MTYTVYAFSEGDLLLMAIDLFERSDSCTTSQPSVSRQYALQAYRLGVYSEKLRSLIVKERIKGIKQQDQIEDCERANRRITRVLESGALDGAKLARYRFALGKAGLAMLVLLAMTFATSTSIDETLPDLRVMASAPPLAIKF